MQLEQTWNSLSTCLQTFTLCQLHLMRTELPVQLMGTELPEHLIISVLIAYQWIQVLMMGKMWQEQSIEDWRRGKPEKSLWQKSIVTSTGVFPQSIRVNRFAESEGLKKIMEWCKETLQNWLKEFFGYGLSQDWLPDQLVNSDVSEYDKRIFSETWP